MYDRQTNSLWSQLLGEAVQGPLQGTELDYLPSFQTTWEDWKAQYPNTTALRKGYYGDRDPYRFYYSSQQAGVIGETFSDDRLKTKEFVIAVEDLGPDGVAFPFSVLSQDPIVNYSYDESHILVVFDVQNGLGIVFDRTIDGQVFTFSQNDEDTLIDNETKSVWDRFSGTAIEGDMEGQRLRRVKSTASFWFGWKDFHPNTIVFGID